MIFKREKLLDNAIVPAGIDKATKFLDVNTGVGVSFEIAWTKQIGGPDVLGEVALQGSNSTDNWVDVNGSIRTIAGSNGTLLYNVRQVHFAFIRARIKSVTGDIITDVTFATTSY